MLMCTVYRLCLWTITLWLLSMFEKFLMHVFWRSVIVAMLGMLCPIYSNHRGRDSPYQWRLRHQSSIPQNGEAACLGNRLFPQPAPLPANAYCKLYLQQRHTLHAIQASGHAVQFSVPMGPVANQSFAKHTAKAIFQQFGSKCSIMLWTADTLKPCCIPLKWYIIRNCHMHYLR